jgi:hypothetical protein
MRKRQKLIWILFGCGITAVLILILWRQREPTYAGHTLSQWVFGLGAAHGINPAFFYGASFSQGVTLSALVRTYEKGSSITNAEAAIQQIGPKAVPFLLDWTEYQDAPWRKRALPLCNKLPRKFVAQAVQFVVGHGYERQQGAYAALAILGPQAKSAVPALRRQALSSTQSPTTYPALMVLARIGEEGLPTILEVLRNPASPNRGAALLALREMDLRLIFREDVVATLIACLDAGDRDFALGVGGILCSHKFDQEVVMRVFTAALQTNDKHIRDAGMPIRVCLMRAFAVPTLLDLLRDTNSPYSADAAKVLGDVSSDGTALPDTVRPALTSSLRDPRTLVRKHAALALGNFGDDAEPAVPALLDACDDPDKIVRQSATNALFQIPAYAVLKDAAILDNVATEPARTKWIRAYFNDAPGPELARLFEHRDPRIREMATNAFQKLSAANLRTLPVPEDTQAIFKH